MPSFFNLEAPPGFCGFDPNQSMQAYRRGLPHWRQNGVTYFVTFRLADSLPQDKLDELNRIKKQLCHGFEEKRVEVEIAEGGIRVKQEERVRLKLLKMESWLDQGMGECVLRDCSTRKALIECLEYFDGEHYELCSYVIMPNHVHLLIRPLLENTLEKILQSRKRNSAIKINGIVGKQGAVWQAESFDRIVRDAGHLWRCLQYIGRNPGKANLNGNDYTRWLKPEWKAIGWKFLE